MEIFEDFMGEQEGWAEATVRSELWEVVEVVLANLEEQEYRQAVVDRLLAGTIEDGRYAKFVAYVSCSQFLLALQRKPSTKRTFTQLQAQLFKSLQDLPNNHKVSVFQAILNEAIEDETLTVMHGARNVLKSLMRDYA